MGRQLRKIKRSFRRTWRKNKNVAMVAVATLIVGASFVIERNVMDANYTTLLSTIAEGESKGNYNAYYGNAANTKILFTQMTVGEVLDWQKDFVAKGSPSNAVGKYQFIGPTLEGLVNEMKISRNTTFSPALQDELAVQLLKRRGVDQYLKGRMSREEFAHNLSKEWAALPRVLGGNPESSYYAGDGLNEVQVSIDEVIAAIDTLRTPKKS